MKKVFSIVKYVEEMHKYGNTETQIKGWLESWALKCVGLTAEEMKKLSFSTIDSWMIEVEDNA